MKKIGTLCVVLLSFLLSLNACGIPKPDPISQETKEMLESGSDWELNGLIEGCKRVDEAGMPPMDECLEYQHLKETNQTAQKSVDAARENLTKEVADQLSQEVKNAYSMLAATSGDVEFLKQMLEFGVDPNAENVLHQTALMSAANSGHADCVEALINAGANVNAQDDTGLTATLLAANTVWGYQSLRKLIKAGADVNHSSKKGVTALLAASQNNCTSCIYDLVKAGANVNVTDPESGFTPLLFAAVNGSSIAIRTLVDAGAEVNVQGKAEGLTPLIASVPVSHDTTNVLILLNAGANPNITMNDGRSADDFLEYAIMKEEDKTILSKALAKAKSKF